RYREAARLISESGRPELMDMYPYYRVSPPVFSLVGDTTYSYGTLLSISSQDDSSTIYYTVDGSDADESGYRFEEPLLPEEGTNRINAVCVNEYGIMSEQASVVFEIRSAEKKR
ncbi:MAG: chitobiase/beta-hexosaminidase C-terminal domain-containing protein, partial [Lachnospiraceae bacterium]|nr:chitobiase/beta-hexosaminidase C-terminal domain-containing protein [Lachnospiraceae bacterium]